MFPPAYADSSDDPSPLSSPEIIEGRVETGILLLCDHASNAVPAGLNQLGMPPAEMARHIAFDIGAADVTRTMARLLGAPAILTRFSRLLIDPNRGRDDPTLVMRLSDGALVLGNARLTEAQISARIATYYDPYDSAIEAAIKAGMAAGFPPMILSIHSFTPAWKGVPRPWHIGVLWDRDTRLARPLIEALQAQADLIVGDNEPYGGGLPDDTIDRHTTRAGLANALIEIRQDLIGDLASAQAWGERLSQVMQDVLRNGLRQAAA